MLLTVSLEEDCTVVWTETVNEGHTEAGSEDPRPSNPVSCPGARARRTSRLAILPSHHNPLNLISEPLDKKIVGVKTDRIRDGQEKTSRASVSLVSLRLQVRRAPKDEASRFNRRTKSTVISWQLLSQRGNPVVTQTSHGGFKTQTCRRPKSFS